MHAQSIRAHTRARQASETKRASSARLAASSTAAASALRPSSAWRGGQRPGEEGRGARAPSAFEFNPRETLEVSDSGRLGVWPNYWAHASDRNSNNKEYICFVANLMSQSLRMPGGLVYLGGP